MSSIRIEHFDVRYRLRLPPAEAAPVQRRLDELARQRLARRMESLFGDFGDDGALYFIEQMTLESALDMRRDDEALAGTWAQAFHARLLQALHRGTGVIVFRDRAEYIAAYI